MSTLHFWPQDIANNLPVSPLAVMREAASELGQATQGAIEAEVKMDSAISSREMSDYDFVLVSKSLGFRYNLLHVSYNPIVFYPCTVHYGATAVDAQSESEFRRKLAEILRSPTAVSTVKALLAQSIGS